MQSFTPWQQATIEVTHFDHSLLSLLTGIHYIQLFTINISRDHMPTPLYYGLFTPSHMRVFTHILFVVNYITMPSQPRGWNSILSFLQWTAPIKCSFCEVCTWHNLHILVTTPFCCDWRSWTACLQSFTVWQKATVEITHHNSPLESAEITHHDHSIIVCLYHIGCYFLHTSHLWLIVHLMQCWWRGCNST